jgi:hypothetical protein
MKTMFRQNPADFVKPRLEGYLSVQVRKIELDRLEAAPLLFHSGYLTIESEHDDRYSFKLPNAEVEKSYGELALDSVFGFYPKEMAKLGLDLRDAILYRDADKIALIFKNLLAGPTGRQHIAEEEFYHSLIHVALAAMGFELFSEPAWAKGQGDIFLSLTGKTRALIEMKYSKAEQTHTSAACARKLASGLKSAFKDLTKKYPWPLGLTSKERLGLGLSVYGRCDVMAGFLEERELKAAHASASEPKAKKAKPKDKSGR